MSVIPHEELARRKRRIEDRIEHKNLGPDEGPVMGASNIHYELANRSRGLSCCGIGLMHDFVNKLGLAEAIDSRLELLKIHRPYHESDHVLNIAYNALCNGTCLDDIELRRNDEVFLDALGAKRIPDPTTAGDFCRRFEPADIQSLQEAFDAIRLKVWGQQPVSFFNRATFDFDGTMVLTSGECKAGIDINYQRLWGYHPLVASLAETGEVLRILNRSGNRPSHEGASVAADECIALARRAGFKSIRLRGDTDFSQTAHLDRWDEAGDVQFLFGLYCMPNLKALAEDLPQIFWKPLNRAPQYEVKTKPRGRWENVKEEIVQERGFENIRLVCEEVAEIPYRPTACEKAYRLIIVRKNLVVQKGQLEMQPDCRYFFYLTNDRDTTIAELVFEANGRCNQENLLAQLKGCVRSLTAPVDNLTSNWAYMVMTSLAWNLKAWFALSLPERPGRWAERHRTEKQCVLRMEFKKFLNYFIKIPCQLVQTGRKIVFRMLGWNRWQPVFFRLWAELRQ